MAQLSRRHLLAGGIGGGAALLAGCATPGTPGRDATPAGTLTQKAGATASATHDPVAAVSATGTATTAHGSAAADGSWHVRGPQPKQPIPPVFGRGDTPLQYVVISWDGAGESVRNPLLAHFRELMEQLGGSMTLFLSGIYFVPKDRRTVYHPPGRQPGDSAIPFFPADSVRATIEGIGKAWNEGHEIGTHFNGHFCGSDGVASWTVEQWKDEIAQAISFVKGWRTITGFTDLPSLPFDYSAELVGARTPCLDGSTNLRAAANQLGWRYDSSSTGTQVWPSKVGRLWALDMQSIPFSGHTGSVISMDYNMMYNQSRTVNGDRSKRARWQAEAVQTWMAGFKRAYDGNRAPYVIGNHFEGWNGGIYMAAVEQVMRTMATYPDTRFVSFRQLCDILDAQSPATLNRLRTLPVGASPARGWKSFLTA